MSGRCTPLPGSFNLERVALDDVPTYKLLQSGPRRLPSFSSKVVACRLCCAMPDPTASKTSLLWLLLYRPGPMDLIPDFIARKEGRAL